MLEKLKINNVALIKSLEIDFASGFNVVLGETGAGKSIIIDALNFVLGDKADKTLIRNGEEQMKVSAIFSPNKNVLSLIESFGIETEETVVLNRTYNIYGKSEARINGEIVSISMLKQVGEALVDAYSQNESITLLKQKNHLNILDSFKPNELFNLKQELQKIIDKLNENQVEINMLGGDEANRERQIDMLSFQIDEIEQANFSIDEDKKVEETLNKLSNSEKILNGLSNSISLLENENAALDMLRKVVSNFSSIEKYDEKLSEFHIKFQDTLISLDELAQEIFSVVDEYNFDENALNALIERRELLDNLKRKYGGSLAEVNNFCFAAKENLDKLENAKELLNLKEHERKQLLMVAEENFKNLSLLRQKHAKEIEDRVVSGLKELGIIKAKFKISFFPLVNSVYDVKTFSINCLEDVEFLFSANDGEDLKPLAKTISGGEMNRFMLTFKNIIADENSSQTLILDEIDAGISGQTANSVANKILNLSKVYQIICITHLPQVASLGDSFYYVSKSSMGGRTETVIKALEEDEIVKEIAFLTYGSLDEKKFSLTKEMLLQNKKLKQ